MLQACFDFTTSSPINVDKLTKQNKRLYNYLESGQSIHCLHPARIKLGIGYLNSRISDLINRHKVRIYKRNIKVRDALEQLTTVTEYSMKPFN